MLAGRVEARPGGLERAFAAGARAYLMSHPHNPTGTSLERAELESVAALAARHGVTVIADEVHSPMTMPGATHVPYLSVSAAAAETGVTLPRRPRPGTSPGSRAP